MFTFVPQFAKLRVRPVWVLVTFTALVCAACGSSGTTATSVAPTAPSGAATPLASPTAPTNVRGSRYCEILLGFVQGTNTSFQVYNTFGVNDCPPKEWNAVNPDQVKQQYSANFVEINGPRVWMMDAFSGSTQVLDPTVKNIGGVEMREAGVLSVPTKDVPAFLSGNTPYQISTVNRDTVWIYDAGKPLYELIDPQGEIFIMQSFSQQVQPQTREDLPNLGSKLNLPAGWTYREFIPKEQVQVAAVNQIAHVTQDELKDTYQLSQLPPAPTVTPTP